MSPIPRSISTFLGDNRGAVTVDYVVLSAVAMAIAVSSLDVVMDGLRTLVSNVNGESTGVDISSIDETLSYNDGFENGAPGWEGASPTDVEGRGSVLQVAGSGSSQSIYKDFVLKDGLPATIIEFDMYAMDSLDGESGFIFIGGQKVGELTKGQDSETGNTVTTFNAFDIPGMEITGSVIENGVDLGGNQGSAQWWKDSQAKVRIIYETPDPNLTIGFGSNANQDVGDESFLIDNFSITGLVDPDAPESTTDTASTFGTIGDS